MCIESVIPSKHLILRCSLLLFSIFPSIRVFPNESVLHIRWLKYWSFSFNTILPMNIHDWLPLGLTGLISLQSKGLSRIFSNTTVQSYQFFSPQLSLCSNSHIHTWPLEKTAFTRGTFVGKVMSLLFKMLSSLVITFLPRSKDLFISWLQSPSAVILESPKIKSVTVSTVSPFICHEVMEPDTKILVFWILSFKPTFSLSSLLSSRSSLVPLCFLP